MPLNSDANTSFRTAPSRRVQFPPLQFVSKAVRTATKPYATRCHIPENVHSFDSENHMSMICLQSSYTQEVCLEHAEKQVEAGTVEGMQSLKQRRMTNADGCCDHFTVTDNVDSGSSVKLSSCPPFCLKPPCEVCDTACNSCLSVGVTLHVDSKDFTVDDKPLNFSHKQDLTMFAENTSGVNFDINTPSCEVEPSDFSEGHKLANEVTAEIDTCQSRSILADHISVEPLRVLSFSHLERSLDVTEDPVERVICAAELNENMSELVDKYDESSSETYANGQHSFFLNKHNFFSAVNSLTPFENHSNKTILVSDTPVSDYGLSYRQRALRAGNIRLRYRTRKS